MKVSRITTAKLNGKDKIRIYGYNENGQAIKQLKDFTNYIYLNKEDLTKLRHNYTVIDDKVKPYNYNLEKKLVSKVALDGTSFSIPAYINDIAYQSDINVENKYMNDNKLEWSRKRHIAYFDIETYYDEKDPKSNNADRADAPVTSIAFYSNVFNKYFVLVWHPTIKVDKGEVFNVEIKNGNENYYYFDNEVDLLQTFCNMIKQFNVDIITGWYSHGYDVPYIVNRLDKIGLSKNLLSPQGNSWIAAPRNSFGGTYTIKINGLDSIDMMDVVQSMNYNLQNNKLDTAAKQILGQKFRKVTQATWRDWQDDLDGFLKYAVRDVQILWKIDEKLKVFEYLIQMQMLSGVTSLNEIQSVTRLIDSLILKKYWNKFVFPNNTKKDRVNFKGGLTIDPTEPGIHNNVAVFDYASLYPTTIMAYNISPETYLFSLADLGHTEFNKQIKYLDDNGIKYVDTGYNEQLFGQRYVFLAHTETVGIYPQLTDELYHTRKMYKKQMKESKDPDEIMLADKRQYATKIILNSMYGAFGFNFFRLYVPQAADAITFLARQANRFAMDNLSRYGKVLYGDTDSQFLKVDGDMTELLKYIDYLNNGGLKNDLIKKYNNGLNDKYCQYNLEHEQTLAFIYFGDRKKRYYSIRDDGSKYIHGLNIIRKDTPELIKVMLDELCEKSVRGQIQYSDFEDIYQRILNAKFSDIAVHKSFSKSFEQYDKTVPQHVKGALFANEHFNLQIKSSDTVFLFYINSFCEPDIKPANRKNVICLREQDFDIINSTDKFEMDYIEFMEKQIIQPMRQFDKIDKVKQIIDQWCSEHSDNYRLSKVNGYVFKKKK